MATPEQNKQTVARYWDALYDHDWSAIATFFTDDANYVDVGTGEQLGGAHGPAEIVARLRLGLESVPEHRHEMGRMIAEDDMVVTEHAEEWVWHTGERVLHPFTSVMELTPDGLIRRWWDYSNLSNLLDHAPGGGSTTSPRGTATPRAEPVPVSDRSTVPRVRRAPSRALPRTARLP
ncbi:MAG: nuclear transport factor 2 family protein [Acidimicrobiales bacterium]